MAEIMTNPRRPSKHLSKKSLLIILHLCAQVTCLLAGVFLFASLFTIRLQNELRSTILKSNQEMVEQASLFIQELHQSSFPMGSESWSQLQSIVERLKLPNDGFLCVIEHDSGKLLCHPHLRRVASIESPAVYMLNTAWGSTNIGQADGAGWADMPNGRQLVAVSKLPELGLRVLAIQPEEKIISAIGTIIAPFFPIGGTTVLIITCLSIASTMAVINRYENRLACINENLEKLVEQRTQALKRTRDAVIFGLARIAESRDTDTGDHLDRISSFVTILARRLKPHHPELTDSYIEMLGIASSLHDIGKVGIPDSVLLKPEPLSANDRTIMETHVTIGAECLSAIIERLGEDDFLQLAYEIAMWHHEKYDGSGYPTRLSGEQIPISARIVAIADVYDALISPRIYKRPMSHEWAKQIILQGIGKHFDPAVVEAFLASEEEFKAITQALHLRLATLPNADRQFKFCPPTSVFNYPPETTLTATEEAFS